jgi:hypothetical protein
MSQLLATLPAADITTILNYQVIEDGAIVDVTNANPIKLLLARIAAGSDNKFTNVNGGVDNGPEGRLSFSAITSALPLPLSRLEPDIYECRIEFNDGNGTPHVTPAFRIAVVTFP